MKKLLLLPVLLFLATHLLAGSEPIEVPTAIKRVTVFIKGAQVFREGSANIPAGRSVLKFTGLINSLETNSILLDAEGDFTILSIRYQINYFEELRKETDKRALELTAQQKALYSKKTRIAQTSAAWKEKESLLIANKELGGANSGVSVVTVKEMMELYDQKLAEIKIKQIDLAEEMAGIDEEINKIANQLNELRVGVNVSAGEVLVEVVAKAPVKASFVLSYVCEKAFWKPLYDIRAEDISRPLNLTYKGLVRQMTGEDWKEVKLTLSTGNPTQNGTMPVLSTWRLRHWRMDQEPPTPPGTIVDSYGVTQDSDGDGITDIVDKEYFSPPKYPTDGYGMAKVPGETEAQEDFNRNITVQTHTSTTTFSFVIEEPYTIFSDGKEYTVEIKNHTLPVSYRYYSAPRLDEDAFLVARITGWEGLQLLNGKANLYFEGSYVGQSDLVTTTGKDTLELSLGRDKGIILSRSNVKELTKKKWMGGTHTESRSYQILVRNQKQQTVSLLVEDLIPISTTDQIKIEDLSFPDGTLDKEQGRVSWEFELKPGQSKTLRLDFSVKYPKGYTVEVD